MGSRLFVLSLPLKLLLGLSFAFLLPYPLSLLSLVFLASCGLTGLPLLLELGDLGSFGLLFSLFTLFHLAIVIVVVLGGGCLDWAARWLIVAIWGRVAR